MARIRILGPAADLETVLGQLQVEGVVHLAAPSRFGPLEPRSLSSRERRHRSYFENAREDAERALSALGLDHHTALRPRQPPSLPRSVHLVRRLRRKVGALIGQKRSLDEERALLLKYRPIFGAVEALYRNAPVSQRLRGYSLILRPGTSGSLIRLREGLRTLLGDAFELFSHVLPDGETVVLLMVPELAEGEEGTPRDRMEQLMVEADLAPLSLPSAYTEMPVPEAVAAMQRRLEEISAEVADLEERLRRLARDQGPALLATQALIRDLLLELEALERAAVSRHAFVLEGWAPAVSLDRLERRLADALGSRIVVERQSTEDWVAADAPVVLSNPRLFRPFETVVRLLPLPRYGSIDPTPFVAVFFPMFFGVILGDVGYGLLLTASALALRIGAPAGSLRRSVAEIAGACALFAILFGVLYGEFFGDLGRRLLSIEPIFDRGEALLPFLALALSLGFVHVIIGLCLGAISALRTDPRSSLGKGLSVFMLLILAVALLAALRILPEGLFTTAAIAALVVFPILVIVEGIVAPIELLSTIGHILSYARIMALGTASVIMAVVANRLVGALGSVLVGVVFGLIFHLVNFVLGVFGPTIHALRLHYVEFFGKFYSPGGLEYRPFGRWRPNQNQAS